MPDDRAVAVSHRSSLMMSRRVSVYVSPVEEVVVDVRRDVGASEIDAAVCRTCRSRNSIGR